MQGSGRASDEGFTDLGQLGLFDEIRKVQAGLGHNGWGNQDMRKTLFEQAERVDLRKKDQRAGIGDNSHGRCSAN